MTVVRPSARFGTVKLDKDMMVSNFLEKAEGESSWVNGGFFVLNKKIFKYLKNDQTIWEREPMESLAKDNQLSAFKHEGFWQPMDTIREKELLDEMWYSNKALWKLW